MFNEIERIKIPRIGKFFVEIGNSEYLVYLNEIKTSVIVEANSTGRAATITLTGMEVAPIG